MRYLHVLLLLAGLGVPVYAADAKPPNIVLIFADDK
jgi:hypothetical protein